MAHRPTMRDVADAAGVSAATVDRVLNARTPVREATARRVAEAAHRIGYHASVLIDHRLLPDLPEGRFGVILRKPRQAFYAGLAEAIEREVRAREDIRGEATVTFAESARPEEIAERLGALAGSVDAIAATAVNHPLVAEAVRELGDGGIATIALLSDFAQGVRASYIGLNNLKAGRVAAWMTATAAGRPGKVAIFVGGYRWHGHELRETGFRSWYRENRADFTVLDTMVNLETRELTYEATLDLLSRHPDVVALHVAGGGMEGAIAALRETRAPGEVALVVNELVPESRAALTDGYATMVIATPIDVLARDLGALLSGAVRSGANEASAVVSQRFLEPVFHVPESL